MKIAVLSCDKNDETFEPFHHCMEKYWPNHPEVVYFTETALNPYYRTITIPHDLQHWTGAVRKFLELLDDEIMLIMVDDCFIRQPVDVKRIEYAAEHLVGNTACFNFEKSFDENDEVTALEGFMKRPHGSKYEVSIMCGLWNKAKLMKVLEPESDPWEVEFAQNNCGFDYYINSGDYIIDWGYRTYIPTNIFRGKWCRNVISFFEKEGIAVDYSKKGFR